MTELKALATAVKGNEMKKQRNDYL